MTTGLFRDPQPDAGPEPLDPALLRAIRPSASRMAAAEETFIQLLSEDIADLVGHLPDRGRQLCVRTARTVLWLALSGQPTDAAIRSLHWLGEANQADGFPASDYVTVGHSLVRIAREMSGIKWTTTTGSAWIRLFMWLQPHLRAGARPPAPPEEPVRPPAPRAEPALHEPVYQQTVYEQAARQQAAYQEAAYQDAARREAFEQPIRPTAADVVADIPTLADILRRKSRDEPKGEPAGEPADEPAGEAEPVPARDQTMPMTALDRDE